MSGFYRGVGGTGDATGDTVNATTASIAARDAALAAQAAAETASAAASSSQTSASTSASSASTSATNAANSASSASTSASNAATSASTATTAASTATTQASNASASANSASTSASTATSAASTATTQASNASTSATNAAASEANSLANRNAAATSATNASTSASAAATSATAAASSATSAASSAAAASAVVLSNEPVRHSVRPSLLLDFANTKTLDPRITFSRPTTATYYDEKTTAVAEQNLITNSSTMSGFAGNGTTLTANTTTAPDGTTTALGSVETATTAVHRTYLSAGMTAFTGTLSMYVKANGRTIVSLCGGTNIGYAVFDLTAVAVTQQSGVTSPTITSVGSGWYRISITATGIVTPTISLATATTYTADSYGSQSYAGDGTSGIYTWGVQAESRSSVTAYTPTTTAAITNYIPVLQTAASGQARFDHNPTTGESLGLLIEEQRTNLLTYSSDYTNAIWGKSAVTVTATANIAPDGTQTAQLLQNDTTTGSHGVYETVSFAVGSTMTIYAKAGTASFVGISNTSNFAAYSGATFNLSTGAVTTTSNCTASMTSVGNGWYRCTVANTTTYAGSFFVVSVLESNQAPWLGYTGTTKNIFIWGAQLEAGSFATSYIPTVASQVTRSADSASMTNTNFSSWYNNSEGTLYSESLLNGRNGFTTFVGIDDGTNNNKIGLYENNGDTSVAFAYTVAGTAQCNITQTVANIRSNTLKCAGAYKVNDFAFSTNATATGTDTSGVIVNMTTLRLGSNPIATASTLMNGTIKKVAYYPKRLTNSELQGLTTV